MLEHACRKWASRIGGALTISLLLVSVLPAQAPAPNPVGLTTSQPEPDKKKPAEARRQEAARKQAEEEAQKRARAVEAILNGGTTAAPGDLQHFTPIPDTHKPFGTWIEIDSMWWRPSR